MLGEGQEILDKRYRVIKRLGGGAFGEIFKGMFFTLIFPFSSYIMRLVIRST